MAKPKLKKSDPECYLYTLLAVRRRFRRGYSDAYLFLPNNGAIIRVTPKGYERAKKLFNHTSEYGTA